MGNSPNPWDELDPPQQEELDSVLISILGSALSEVLHHIIGTEKELNPATVGRRAIAIIHEMRPDILNGRSARSLAKDCRCSHAWLSKVSIQFRDQVGTFSPPVITDRVRALHRLRAKAVHNGTYQAHSDWVQRREKKQRELLNGRKTECVKT